MAQFAPFAKKSASNDGSVFDLNARARYRHRLDHYMSDGTINLALLNFSTRVPAAVGIKARRAHRWLQVD